MVRPQLGRELGLAETAEAEAEFPHREGLGEQRHVLPPQPLDRMRDRPLAQPALDDPRIRQESEVPDVMAGVGQPPDDVGEIRRLDQQAEQRSLGRQPLLPRRVSGILRRAGRPL